MLTRLTGRLVTSPLAFLLAGVMDFLAFWRAWARLVLRRSVR
jgi:hypothetical protein